MTTVFKCAYASKSVCSFQVCAHIQRNVAMDKLKQLVGFNLPVTVFCARAFDTVDRRDSEGTM